MREDDGYAGMPRWVKITGIVLVGLVVVAVGVMALSGGQHSPLQHTRGGDTPSGDAGGDDHGAASPVAAGAVPYNVTARSYAFEPSTLSIPGGTNVAIVLTSADGIHDFTIDALEAHVSADEGETATGGFHAGPPGTYTFYCSVPGHRAAGMVGTLVIGGHG